LPFDTSQDIEVQTRLRSLTAGRRKKEKKGRKKKKKNTHTNNKNQTAPVSINVWEFDGRLKLFYSVVLIK